MKIIIYTYVIMDGMNEAAILGKIVPVCAMGGGNTNSPPKKTIHPVKRWCFTLNNYTDKDICAIEQCIKKYCVYGIYGKETGLKKGTEHLQGYIEFKKKDRPLNKKYELPKTIHWEKAKGSKKQNKEYCAKDGNVWEFPRPYNIEIELYDWQKKLWKLLNKEPDDRSIYWIWEEEGNKGKTVFQKYVFLNLKKRTIVLSGKCADMKNGIVQYELENNELPEVILINIPRVNKNHVSISGIEQIKDMFFFSPKYEGGMICGPSPHVMIFANEPIEGGKLSSDRIKEIYIGEI